MTSNSSMVIAAKHFDYYDPSTWSDCYDFGGPMYMQMEGVAYGWNALPIRSDFNDHVNGPVATSMILSGIFGIFLNLYCGRVILKNENTSKETKFFLLIDCFCRLNESWTELYKAYCVLTWECVNTNGYPISGILVNLIVTSANMGMIYSMQMIGNGLCLNRFFAVFFDGRFYWRIEKIALPHGLLLWAFPCIVYFYQIGIVSDIYSDFKCYGCWYFTPLEYCNKCGFTKDGLSAFFVFHFDQIMYGVLGFTMMLDLLTLWKVGRVRILSLSKKRADVRLSIMLVTTHFITICFLVSNYTVNCVFGQLSPIGLYLILEVMPFLVHSILGMVIIYFNLPSRRSQQSMPSTGSTNISVSQASSQNKRR